MLQGADGEPSVVFAHIGSAEAGSGAIESVRSDRLNYDKCRGERHVRTSRTWLTDGTPFVSTINSM